MYESFYGLREKPFQITPNPAFLYISEKYANALTYLEYGLMERTSFILLTGEVGAGKTTLVRHMLGQIDTKVDVAMILNTNVSSEQLLYMILTQYEITGGQGGKARMLDALNQSLIDRFSRNRHALLIIDEAQNLSREAMEEIRMLSNLQSNDQMLLQVMLVGQPEIIRYLKRPDMTQLNQRISIACHLPALTRKETGEYIACRLKKAGGNPGIFTRQAVQRIFLASRGIPRTINILCDSALVYGFADEHRSIGAPVIDQVLRDRGEVGLWSMQHSAEPLQSAMEPGSEMDVKSRLESLDARLVRLERRVGQRIELLERKTESLKGKLVRRMQRLYAMERKKNDKLVAEYATLREKYSVLLEEMGRKDASEAISLSRMPESTGQSTEYADGVHVCPDGTIPGSSESAG